MSIYEIAQKLHCILNQTDSTDFRHLDASIAIGNISLLECDENSKDNIYIYLNETLASIFDSGLYGSIICSECTVEACKEAELFLDSLRDENGELIEWYFPDEFTIFVQTIKNGYLSSEVIKNYEYNKKHREEYIKWRFKNNKL